MSDGCKRLMVAVLFLVALSTAAGQRGGGDGAAGLKPQNQDQEPSPTNNSDIAKAKADREQNIKDAARLAQLAAEVKKELEDGSQFTLSVASLQKAEEMEKLSKKLHVRMKADNAAPPKPLPGMDVSKRDASKKGRD